MYEKRNSPKVGKPFNLKNWTLTKDIWGHLFMTYTKMGE